MAMIYTKIKSDRQYYEELYEYYKKGGKHKNSVALASQLRTVIVALKKLEQIH